jgi:metallo-beta-lactamase family protein
MTLSIRFLGAARAVTGSKHLLTVGDQRVLLECGLVQGPRAMAWKANRELPLRAGELDAVVLSHAHVDHSGSLPRLVREGYHGPIWCTEATRDLAAILLRDSARIQASDAAYLRAHGESFEPLYDEDDVERTVRLLRAVPYHRRVTVVPGVAVEFLDAGHILGAAIVVADLEDGPRRLRLVFTGDYGRRNLPILRDPERLPECDVLLTESTYGDRVHESQGDLERDLQRIVDEEAQRGGRILIPAFAVGRTQIVVLFLGRLMAQGRIPRLPIFVDSPLSLEATRVMARHHDLFDRETKALVGQDGQPFFFAGVRYVASVEESKELNGMRQGVIVAASGMCESGRILHHLKQSVGRSEDCVLLVGYQGQGTLGRRLQEGHARVRIFGRWYDRACRVHSLSGFSAHADGPELVAASAHLAARTQKVFVVHGEERPALAHARRLTETGFRDVVVPEPFQEFEL